MDVAPSLLLLILNPARFRVPLILAFPFTSSFWDGVIVPIPTLPLGVTVKNCVPVEEATTNGLVEPAPWINNVDAGTLVPMPSLWLAAL